MRSCRTVLSLSVLAAMRRVLHLKMVTQCAMLADCGSFLVLADKVKAPSCCPNLLWSHPFLKFQKSLFAYPIEALVPSSPENVVKSYTPQKLNNHDSTKDVQFFSVGTIGGRTLVIYMTKKRVGSRSMAFALESIPRRTFSRVVHSARSSLLLATSMRGQELQHRSASIMYVHLIYHQLEFS